MIRERNRYRLLALAPGEDPTSLGTVEVPPQKSGRVALIEMRGMMTEDPTQGFFNRLADGSDVGTWADLRAALHSADEAVGGEGGKIVIDGSGPGSTIAGLDTTMATLAGLKAETWFWNSGHAFSGYGFLATAADFSAGSPLSSWGSLSTRLTLLDTREAEREAGVEVIEIVPEGAELKGEISDKLIAHFRARATESAAVLARLVGEGRDLSPSKVKGLMDARTMGQAEAVKAGLVDQTFSTREEFLASLTTNPEEPTMATEPTAAPAPAAPQEPPAVATPPTEASPAVDLDAKLDRILALTEANAEANAANSAAIGALKAKGEATERRAELADAAPLSAEALDEAEAWSASLTPEQRAGVLKTVKAAGAGRELFGGHRELLETAVDVQADDGAAPSRTADPLLKGLTGDDVDREDFDGDMDACKAADAVSKDRNSAEWKAAHRAHFEGVA